MPTTPVVDVAAIATAFARALDADDFETAATFLAPDCLYVTGAETLDGPRAILESYERNSAWARQNLDAVEYESTLVSTNGASASIAFLDRVAKGTETLDHRCRQTYDVDARGLIVRIEHHDLPGEREKLRAFFDKCGIVSRTTGT